MKTAEEIQTIVDELFYEKGEFIAALPQYDDLLAEVGLTRKDITEEVRQRAERHIRERLFGKFRKKIDSAEDKATIAPPPPSKGRKIMTVSETDARQLLVELGKEAAADARLYPVNRLARCFNDADELAKAAKRAVKLAEESESQVLFKNIFDAVSEGETIVVAAARAEDKPESEAVPDAQPDVTEEEEAVPAILEAPRRKRKVKHPESNGHPEEGGITPPEHYHIHIKELDKPKLNKISAGLARKFRDLERYPNDRPLTSGRCDMIREAIRAGLFRGSEWVSAKCLENNQTYRINGKHTSNVICELYEAREEFAEFYQLVREYECKTMADVAHLFSSFDPRGSARSKIDVVRGFASTEESTAGLPPRMLSLVTTGLAFSVWERAYNRQSPTEQGLLLLQHTDFSGWVTELLHNKKGAEHLRRMPVVAAMARTWTRDADEALEFWTKLRDDCDDPKDSPIRRLYKFLLTRKIGAVKDASESVSNREVFVRCLLAWNEARGEEHVGYKHDMETPLVV